MDPEYHACVRNSLPLVSNLSQMKPLNVFTFYFSKLYFSIIILVTVRHLLFSPRLCVLRTVTVPVSMMVRIKQNMIFMVCCHARLINQVILEATGEEHELGMRRCVRMHNSSGSLGSPICKLVISAFRQNHSHRSFRV